MKKIDAVMETLNVWGTRDVNPINDVWGKYSICSNFLLDRVIGNNNISNHVQICLNAFLDINFDFNIDEINGLLRAKFNFSAIHSGMFFGLPPTNRKIQIPGYAIYKIEDNLINKAYLSLDVSDLIQQGSLPVFMNNNNDILSTINEACNTILTKKEAYIASLWVRGASIKKTAFLAGISNRTVEDYRNKIKNKLKISNKNHLYDYLKNLRIIDLFFCLSE